MKRETIKIKDWDKDKYVTYPEFRQASGLTEFDIENMWNINRLHHMDEVCSLCCRLLDDKRVVVYRPPECDEWKYEFYNHPDEDIHVHCTICSECAKVLEKVYNNKYKQ